MPTGVYKRKPFTAEHRKNLSISRKGTKFTLEHRKNMSLAHTVIPEFSQTWNSETKRFDVEMIPLSESMET